MGGEDEGDDDNEDNEDDTDDKETNDAPVAAAGDGQAAAGTLLAQPADDQAREGGVHQGASSKAKSGKFRKNSRTIISLCF